MKKWTTALAAAALLLCCAACGGAEDPFSPEAMAKENAWADTLGQLADQWLPRVAETAFPEEELERFGPSAPEFPEPMIYRRTQEQMDFNKEYNCFIVPATLFHDQSGELWAGLVNYYCMMTGDTPWQVVQTAFYVEDGRVTLSGLVWGNDLLQSPSALYDYLKRDPRLKDRMADIPELPLPPGSLSLDTSNMPLGSRMTRISSPWEDHLLIEYVDYDTPRNTMKTALYSLEENAVAAETESPDFGTGWVRETDGSVTVLCRNAANKTVQTLHVSRDAPAIYWNRSGNWSLEAAAGRVSEEDWGIFLTGPGGEKTQLVELEDSPSAPPQLCGMLSPHRFVWLNLRDFNSNRGDLTVFDLATGAQTPLSPSGALCSAVGTAGSRLLYRCEGEEHSGYAVYDDATGEHALLGLGDRAALRGLLSGDGGHVAVWHTGDESDPGMGLMIFDAATGGLLADIPLENGAGWLLDVGMAGNRPVILMWPHAADRYGVYLLPDCASLAQ